jgi:endonuclease-3
LRKTPPWSAPVTAVMRRLAKAIEGLEEPAVEKIAKDQQEDPFQVLIATMLSAQTRDAVTAAASERLFRVARTPRTMAKLPVEKIQALIYPVSFYRNKAVHVRQACEQIMTRYGGRVPSTMEELLTLPGVGRKTANVVLNVAFGEPTIAVDTHIFRVGNRTGLAPGKTPREVEDKLVKVVPKKYMLHAHHWLILHGRYICVARKPKCPECPVRQVCEYKAKSTLDDFALGKPAKAKPVAKAKRLAKARSAVARKEIEPSSPRKRRTVRGMSHCVASACPVEPARTGYLLVAETQEVSEHALQR